ncbi:MAG: hypothetical protein V1650_04465 [Candidatus Omnitrophota bacterium]
MEDKKMLRIAILGWGLIAYSVLTLFAMAVIAYRFLYFLNLVSSLIGASAMVLQLLFICSLIFSLIMFVVFLMAGIGILRLKRWAYYIALSLPLLYVFMNIEMIWIFGFQTIISLGTVFNLFVYVAMFIFLMQDEVIEAFQADFINNKGSRINPNKFIIISSSIGFIIFVIPIFIWLFAFESKAALVPIPQKLMYHVQDDAYIWDNCEKRDILDYRVSIPKDLKIYMISRGIYGWTIMFAKKDDFGRLSFIMLESGGDGKRFFPLSRVLNFKTVYDFEKNINYPSLNLACSTLRGLVNPSGTVYIDDASTSTWRGFIKGFKAKDKDENIYSASLYSLKTDKSCNIAILVKNEAFTLGQAKSVIASLECVDINLNSAVLFEKGKDNLSVGDFISAALNFMNALYFDEKNPEYAYYLAFALSKQVDVDGRKNRLEASRNFLEYCLKLNPEHQEAKDLLVLVNDEIRQLNLLVK